MSIPNDHVIDLGVVLTFPNHAVVHSAPGGAIHQPLNSSKLQCPERFLGSRKGR